MRIRLSILLPIVVPVLLAAGYSTYWFYAADAVRRGIDEWVAVQRANGIEVRSEPVDVGGFPLKLEAGARQVVMTDAQGATWQSAGLSAEAQPWRLTHIDYRIDGPQTLVVPGVRPVTVTADSGTGDIRLAADGRLSAGSLTLSDLTVLLPALGDLKAATMELAIAERANGGDSADLAAGGDLLQIDLPVAPFPAFGQRVDHAGLDVTVTAPVPAQLRVPHLTVWRESGGVMHIERLYLEWGPLVVEANGTVTLDAALQPQANLTANVRGFLQTVDALVAAGMVEGDKAGLIKAGLALLAGPPDPDGTATLTAPLQLRDRRLFLGPLQLAELRPIVWP